MAVNIVAVYANPTLLTSFSAPAVTLAGESAISNAEVADQCALVAIPLWDCPSYPAPNSWCFPGLSFVDCQLQAYYTLPNLLKGGVWDISLGIAFDSAGTPPDPFDPDTQCYYDGFWGTNGSGFWDEYGFGPIPTWPGGQINFITGATGACDYADTTLSATVRVGIRDINQVCLCGPNGMEISFGRGGGISSYVASVSGVWISDFPP